MVAMTVPVTVTALLVAVMVGGCCGSLDVEKVETWNGGFKFSFDLTAEKEMKRWYLTVKLSGPIDSVESQWVAKDKRINDNTFRLASLPDNSHLRKGQSLSNVVVVHCRDTCRHGQHYTLTVTDNAGGTSSGGGGGTSGGGNTGGNNNGGDGNGNNGGGGGNGGGDIGQFTGGAKNYSEALRLSILFYDAQRSGTLPANNPIPWRGDSATDDCVNGGWYDAGDHVKFGLPFGFATHVLLWGLHKFKGGYEAAGQLDNVYDSVKWATDYMLNAYNTSTNQLVAQIGDGDADHKYWVRPEDMKMDRPCHKVGRGRPASELYGEWAASLAAGSLVWKDKGDRHYAKKMLKAAESMYDFGKGNPGSYTSSVPNVGTFYGSSGYNDEMCLGAIWLYKATKEDSYLQDAKRFHDGKTAWAFSWDDKTVACQLLLYEETGDSSYKDEVLSFISSYQPGSSITYTPCGLAWRDRWGANRYAANAAWVALAAAEAGIGEAQEARWGAEQINFLLGDNSHDGGCFSYEIGYGQKYPKHPHHRGASFTNYDLDGALVGGPDQGGHYTDDQNNYITNEVAIDYNAGFQSALAALSQLQAEKRVPKTYTNCPCKHH